MDPCADFPEETALVVEPIQSSWGIKKSEGQNEPSILSRLENVDVFFVHMLKFVWAMADKKIVNQETKNPSRGW